MADQKLTERTVIATSLDADLIHVVQGGVSYKHSKTNLLKEDRVRLTALETPDYTTQGNTFNGVSQLVQTTAAGILPVLDGSLLTNLPSGLGIGTVTSVVAGNGLDFTTITGAGSVTMGTPASTTGTTINAVSATSHTHALDMTGVSVAAADVTIADAGGLITATEVEGALQENRTLIDVNTPLAADAVLNADTVTTPMGFVIDEDSFASDLATKVPTQQSVKAYVTAQVASAIVGGVYYQGGYNAGTNTPDLETPVASTVFKGFMWTVTVLGDFFTEAVQVGDVLIAEVDDPSVLTDWTVVQSNLDASSIKALYESNADTNAFTDAEQTKVGYILVTQAVDLDTMESNIVTNNAKISYTDAAAVSANTAKISFDTTSSTRLANTSGTNTGDQVIPVTGVDFDPVGTDNSDNNAINTLYSGLITNANHTGEVTGATALTIADNIIDEANLKLDEAPTNDYVLTADSTKTGGMKWAAPAGGALQVSIITTSTAAVKNYMYVLTADLTLTLPITPIIGDRVGIANRSDVLTCIVARNGENIAGLAEDITIDSLNIGFELVYTNATQGWILQ